MPVGGYVPARYSVSWIVFDARATRCLSTSFTHDRHLRSTGASGLKH